MSTLLNNIDEHQDFVERMREDAALLESFAKAREIMTAALAAGHCIYVAGNGGSMADGIHFAEELIGNFRAPRKPMAAVALSDAAAMTCIGNDYGFDYVFSRQVQGLCGPGDVFLGLSTSGNSANIVNACEAAHGQGAKVIALTAGDGGKMAHQSDVALCVPKSEHSDRIQEMHMLILHSWVQELEQHLNK